jgi:uncharacterized membrane protein
MRPSFPAILFLLLAVPACTGHRADGQVNYNQRDDKYRILGLKRAREVFETARRDYDRQQELFSRQLISRAELDRTRAAFADAEVNYQQSLLAVLFEQQFVSVARAVKSQARDGSKHVRLTLANTSGMTAEFRALAGIDDQVFRSLQPDVVNNVYVSLSNADGAIVSQPYEAKIVELRTGAPATLDFTLLQDLDAVTVNLIYANGTQRTMKIFLQKDLSGNRVAVQSEQFSQEAELGTTAAFDLTFELFSGAGSTYSLEVVNLPGQVTRYFKDPAGSARLSQLKFTAGTTTRKAVLHIGLPDRPTESVVMDRPIPFYVLVIPHDRRASLGDLSGRTFRPEELEHLQAGYVRLELVPRGRGKLVVRAPQLYQAIAPDGTVRMSADVVNEGSRRLDNIEIAIDPPLEWTKKSTPAVLASLEPGAEHRIELQCAPPRGVAAGRYEVRLRTSALSDAQPVNAEDKTVIVEVLASGNALGTVFLVIVLLGLTGTVIVFGIRLSRK